MTAIFSLILLFCGVSMLDGCGNKQPARPNVILIVLDTVRADHMSCYGYDRETTPVLSELAASGTLYTRMRATSPWTLPSHASLFTGLYSYEHGAYTVWVDLPVESTATVKSDAKESELIDNIRPLPAEWPTISEVLGDAGYRTGAIGANIIYLDKKYGLARGFDIYDMQDTHYDSLNSRVAAWLDRRDERPFFLFLNYMDAHSPYNNTAVPGLFDYEVPPNTTFFMNRLYERLLTPSEPLPARALALLTDQYDLGIANVDAGIGQLLQLLRERGLFDDLLLIITSDHGEYLGERRLIAHSKDVYEPVMYLPLLIKYPLQQKKIVDDTPISLVNIAPLILRHVAGADDSFFPYAETGGDLLAENHFSRWKDLLKPWGPRFHRERYVLYRDNMKYILSSDGKNELYDLASDPYESSNLVETQSETAAALEAVLRSRLESGPDDLPGFKKRTLTEEEKRRLKALGYL